MSARIAKACILFVLFGVLWLGLLPRAGAQLPSLIISEVLVGNASTNIDPDYTNYSSWVELQNTTGAAVSLSGYSLSWLADGATTADRYSLPRNTLPAGGRLLIWYDEMGSGAHAPFELDMDGGVLQLLGPGGSAVDSITLDAQRPDLSYGRAPAGGWAYFDPPTPGAANTTAAFATYVNNYAVAPVFSEPGGRYAGARSITLSTGEPGGVVRYTVDGSRPTANSPAYSAPIQVNAVKVLRARTFAPGRITSPTVTQTYLVGVPAHLPAISLATDPAHLFDNRIGIYVVGSNGKLGCSQVANWHQPWERPASVEMYDSGGARLVGQDVGLEIYGNCARNYNMKSFEIKARKTYGDNDIDYALFPGDKPMTSYKRLVLRTGGQDLENTMLRDALASQLLLGRMDIDRSAYRPVVVYVNGQFWGVYGLREKMDEDYVENNYNLDEDSEFDALEENGKVLAGSAARWNEFYNYVKSHNPADPAVYAYLKTQMDMNEFIDYEIAEIYAANTDWPHYNIRYWRAYAPGSLWRWMLHDVDAGFSNHMNSGFGNNTLKLAMSTTGKRAYGSLLLVRLSQNADFRAAFAQRFAAHLNTTFAPARVIGIIDSMAGAIAPDMPAQIARWHQPRSLTIWQSQVAKLRTFATKRPDPMRSRLNEYLGSPGTTTLTTVAGAGGNVLVAGVAVPDNYSGLHFRNRPLTLRAVPEPGQLFVRWQPAGQTTPEITVSLSGPTTYTAIFEAEPPPPPLPALVINEIHYRPAAPQTEAANEFVEIYNADSVVADLSGYTIDAISFTFPAGATIDPGEYIVVAADSANAAYAALPAGSVFDWAWDSPDGQKLSNSSETVALRHADGRVADSLTYDDGVDTPWPAAPDGTGPTLALLAPALDNTDPANWAASRQAGGTPGAENFPPLPPPPPVVINEIHYNPADAQGPDADYEFIELVNPGTETADLSGFTLDGLSYTFPAGTTLAAGQYLVLAANAATYPGALPWPAGELADDGQRLALADAFGQLVDEVTYGDAGDWPAAPDGAGPSLSLGNPALDNSLPASWAASDFAGGTPGAANWPALPLVVSEVHYSVNATLQPGGDDVWEFLEVYNAGDRAFDLSGYTTVGVTMTFPAGAAVAPGETVVLANAADSYAAAGCAVYDWASGGLSSSGETLTLKNRFGAAVLVFTYGSAAPWPTEPKGGGPSLALLDLSYDNSLPASWAASLETGGTPCQVNFP